MSRLPIRLRLTLAFALAMAVVLGTVGAFLYLRLGESLEEQLDDSLGLRAEALSALVRERGGDLGGSELATADDEGFTQVLATDGSLLASTGRVGAGPLLTEQEVARAGTSPVLFDRAAVAGLAGEPARLLALPVDLGGRTVVLAVGASLEDRDDALDGLLTQLLIAGPVALLLSSLAGYLLAAAALRPVEAMRRRAAQVSSDELGRRLPLPRARDEIHRLGETLNAMLTRLETGIARERRFVAEASHELRTPLALLQTELELALRRPRSLEELERSLRSAFEEVDRLVRLAEDLLVLARADEGGLALRRSPVLPATLLERVARRFEARAAAEGRTIEVADGSARSFPGDGLRLEQALGDLVDNALRHAAGTIRLEASDGEGCVELRVGDAGPGFPPDFLPQAFDRFSRADAARGRGGAGLGLAIVAAIAAAHGGDARAANRDGGGAVVSLRLPVSDDDGPAPGAPSSVRPRGEGVSGTRG